MIPTKVLRAAEAHLAAVDPVMAQLIANHGLCTLGRKRRDPFHVLCGSIIGQQLSAKAADTIQARVEILLSAVGLFTPAHFETTSVEALRACGLSNAKGKWLIELAARTRDGRFDLAQLKKHSDEALVEALDELPGIGRWTAEMMLIFAFDRIDIFSPGDAGLMRSIRVLYGNNKPLSERKLKSVTAKWAPYRSVASWYLWRMIDGDISAWT